MNLLILSDLHFEFHADKGEEFVELLPQDDVDVVVLAGDISSYDNLSSALGKFSKKYSHVIHVLGNHEFYDSTFEKVKEECRNIVSSYKNVSILNRSSVVIDGQRFIGSTLWFEKTPIGDKNRGFMNDFHSIKNLERWVYEENFKDSTFLTREVNEHDIVVTHHLPSHKSVHSKFKGNSLNSFFVYDMENLILEKQPKIWIHGHTHESCYYNIKNTTVICNPFGYAGYELNRKFKDSIIRI